jgi:GDP-L-fucose synthase
MSEYKKILVTGASGLVGRSIQNLIAKNKNESEWIFISSKDCDLSNFQETQSLFKNILPTHVIHLAVKLMNGNEMKNHPSTILHINTMININVLKCSHDFNVKKVISVLSSFAYPKNVDMPIKENELHNGKYHENYESYAMSKRYLEVLSRSYRDEYNDNFVTIIPTNIFGPLKNLRHDGPVIESFIKKCINSKNTGENINAFGLGKEYRQFCYAPDLAKVLIWMLDNYNESEPLNITGHEVMIKDILNIIASHLAVSDKIVFGGQESNAPIYRTVCDEKIKQLCKDYVITDIDVAIREAVDCALEK